MGNINLNGGNITINSSDDSIHCSGTLTVNGAIVTAQSGDDGLHCDADFYIKSGKVEVKNSYEGIEALNIYVEGGTVYSYASDDGFNVAGGADGSGFGGPGDFGQGGFRPGGSWGGSSTASGNSLLKISGGYVVVNAQGDGLDSNGSLEISGGTTVVYGTTSGGNGIIDKGDGSNCTFTVSGGILLGVGTSDMFVSPTSGSYIKSTSLNASAGQYVAIKDGSGNIVSVVKLPKSARALIYANSSTVVSSCTVYKGSSYVGTVDAYGYGSGGTITGATTVSKS